jgi:hypothetical protein
MKKPEDFVRWDLSTELTPKERAVQKRLRKSSKFFAFLLDIRAELFNNAFQTELSAAYKAPRGQDPVPPALLAMVMVLQSYTGLSDAGAVDAAENDRRWQLVLGTPGQDQAPFGQGSLVRFRERMIEHNLDQKLVARTVELAKKTGQLGWQKLKVALDSAPLLGAGRVEDTWNLLGRAIRHVIRCKPWPCRNGDRFSKDQFDIDLQAKTVRCPADVTVHLNSAGSKVQFPARTCSLCAHREKCTNSKHGRTLSIHPTGSLTAGTPGREENTGGTGCLAQARHGRARPGENSQPSGPPCPV